MHILVKPFESYPAKKLYGQHAVFGRPFGAADATTISVSESKKRNVGEYIKELSEYVRKHYFSSDTIFKEEQHGRVLPINCDIDPSGYRYRYGKGFYIADRRSDAIGMGPRLLARYSNILALLSPPTNCDEAKRIRNALTVDDETLARRYWADVAPRIIAMSAEVIKLFYDRVTAPHLYITNLTADPSPVPINGISTLTLDFSNPDGDLIVFFWSATCGTLSNTLGYLPRTWTAPATPGTCTVQVDATDLSGEKLDSATLDITVFGSVSTAFATGDVVETTDNLNVRSSPGLSGTVLGVQLTGSLGTVIGGPVFADGFWWWQVNFDTGADGWVAEDFLGLAPPLPLQAAYATFAVFNRTAPVVATGRAVGATVAVFNRALSTAEITNARVHVNTGDGSNLNVRSAPGLSGPILGVQPNGAQGTVIGGPLSANSFQWWQVNFDTGVDGWVAGEFLDPPPSRTQDAHTILAVFNMAAPDAIDGHVEGLVFSVDNLP